VPLIKVVAFASGVAHAARGLRDGGLRDGGLRDGGLRDGGLRDGGRGEMAVVPALRPRALPSGGRRRRLRLRRKLPSAGGRR
jgi:hypothetical protein